MKTVYKGKDMCIISGIHKHAGKMYYTEFGWSTNKSKAVEFVKFSMLGSDCMFDACFSKDYTNLAIEEIE